MRKGQKVQMCNQIYINPRDHTYSLQNLCHCFTSVRCVRPSPPENGYQIASSQHFQSPGSLILFRCGSGYSLNGSARITCQDNGTWNPIHPTCEANEGKHLSFFWFLLHFSTVKVVLGYELYSTTYLTFLTLLTDGTLQNSTALVCGVFWAWTSVCIVWSGEYLRGSDVCFTTMEMIRVDLLYCWDYAKYQTTLEWILECLHCCGEEWVSYCTVCCLKYAPG